MLRRPTVREWMHDTKVPMSYTRPKLLCCIVLNVRKDVQCTLKTEQCKPKDDIEERNKEQLRVTGEYFEI